MSIKRSTVPAVYLSREEEKELIEQIKSGDEQKEKEALKKLLEANQFLVGAVVSRYPNRAKTFSELMKAGNKGLLHALQIFTIKDQIIKRDYKFSAYALWWIRAFIVEALTGLSPKEQAKRGM